jgi:uncharacterized protein
MYARPFVDSLDFARNGRNISGNLPVAELPRMFDMLDNPQGFLSYSLQGGVDIRGMHFLDLSVAGQCRLRCQRCLGGLDYPVQLETRLLLRDQASFEALDIKDADLGNEEFDSIFADAHLDVQDLLEEEILLSLPIAPKHELGTCRAAGGKNRQEERHPFEVLAKLKSS